MSKKSEIKTNPPPGELGGERVRENQAEGNASLRFQFTAIRATRSSINPPFGPSWTEAEEKRLFELGGHYWRCVAELATTESEITKLKTKRAAAYGETA